MKKESGGEYPEFILEAKRIGISETDVLASTNIFQLLNWQIEVSKDIANIQGQIEIEAANNDMSDAIQYAKRNHAKRLLELFVKKINMRVQELKADTQDKKARFNILFVEIAREELDAEMLQEIIFRAEKRL